VNLERAMPASGRFGGHWVQGHVDGVGTVREVRTEGEGGDILVTIRLPEEVRRTTILHGSVAIDGVSLTVNALFDGGEAQVALIPYTYAHTNLSRLRPEDRVNVEGDLLGKYLARWLAESRAVLEPKAEAAEPEPPR
jgi:riboflavin synthase